MPLFDSILNYKSENDQNIAKPVLIIISDGGPDENPRYQNVIEVAIHHFVKRDLDALFLATNAPGRSAYNRVERRMAPLSRSLCGLILPHNFYGDHLNSKNETIDDDIWSENVIDGYQVEATYVCEDDLEQFKENLVKKNAAWLDKHVNFGQYLLQITKCDDLECCKPKRSCLFKFLNNGRLPSPLPLINVGQKLDVIPTSECSKIKIDQFASLFVALSAKSNNCDLFDAYCPSVQSKLVARTCSRCGKYFSTIQFLKEHQKLHKTEEKEKKVQEKEHKIQEKQKKMQEKGKKSEPQTFQRLRPKRIAAVRAAEALAIICYDLNQEDAEWHNISELDLDGLDYVQEEKEENLSMPIMSISEHMSSEWTDEF